MTASTFTFPEFWFYPPYFTLQPVKETQQKQKDIWRQLILRYCTHCRIFTINNDEGDAFPPFNNPAINRRLNKEARSLILEHLVKSGDGIWLDPKTQRTCLVLWKSLSDWATIIYQWSTDMGYKNAVITLEELLRGDEVKGSEIEGIHQEVLVKALKVLETQGKAKMFISDDDQGVKFF